MKRTRAKDLQSARASAADYFESERLKFSGLVAHSLAVCNAIGRQMADPRRGYASWLYMRASVIARTIEQLHTPLLPVHGEIRYLDHASIAALSRSLIETVTVLLYIGDVSVDDEEWWCRKHVIDLHDYKNRTVFLALLGHDSSDPPESSFEFLTERVQANSFFQSLPNERQKKLLDGDEMFTGGRHRAMRKLGWGDRLTRGIYKYLSHQAHAQSMAFHRTEENKLYEPESLAAKGAAAFVTEFARKALGVGCVHMIALFPETEFVFDPVILSAIRSEYTPHEEHPAAHRMKV